MGSCCNSRNCFVVLRDLSEKRGDKKRVKGQRAVYLPKKKTGGVV